MSLATLILQMIVATSVAAATSNSVYINTTTHENVTTDNYEVTNFLNYTDLQSCMANATGEWYLTEVLVNIPVAIVMTNVNDTDLALQCTAEQQLEYSLTYTYDSELSIFNNQLGDIIESDYQWVTFSHKITAQNGDFDYGDTYLEKRANPGTYVYALYPNNSCDCCSSYSGGTGYLGSCYKRSTTAFKSGKVQNLNTYAIKWMLAYHHDCRSQSFNNLPGQEVTSCWSNNIYSVWCKR